MNNNVFKASIECGVKNIVSVLSTCVFPANAKEPFDQDSIHDGFPHPTNYGYAYSKRLLLVLSKARPDGGGAGTPNDGKAVPYRTGREARSLSVSTE